METFLHQLASGLALGGVYAMLALALAMIHTSTRQVNFAQGEMATLSTYLAWKLRASGWSYPLAFAATVLIAFAGGAALQGLLLRRLARAPALASVVVFIGLALLLRALAGFLFGYAELSFDSPFVGPPLFLPGYLSAHEAGSLLVTLAALAPVYLFFRFTDLGLAMRAAAQDPQASRRVGIRVDLLLALGWGLAAAIGAVAGMMAAPLLYLDPDMMSGALLYAFAGAALGGIDSPAGAVVGGFLVGTIENLMGAYVVGEELKRSVALILIVGVLALKPAGLFGRRLVARV